MIDTLIFDLDGVIIDSEPIHFAVEKKLFSELGLNITDQEHLTFVGRSSFNMWQDIKSSADIPYSAEDLVKMSDERYLNELKQIKDLQPINGVKKLITNSAAGLRLAIASSSSRIIIDTVLSRFRLTNYFSVIMSGAELNNSKPHPEIYYNVCEKCGSSPEKCIVIEDSQNGVRAAKSAKMYCIAFLNPNSGIQDLSSADLVINDFNKLDLPSLINEIS